MVTWNFTFLPHFPRTAHKVLNICRWFYKSERFKTFQSSFVLNEVNANRSWALFFQRYFFKWKFVTHQIKCCSIKKNKNSFQVLHRDIINVFAVIIIVISKQKHDSIYEFQMAMNLLELFINYVPCVWTDDYYFSSQWTRIFLGWMLISYATVISRPFWKPAK